MWSNVTVTCLSALLRTIGERRATQLLPNLRTTLDRAGDLEIRNLGERNGAAMKILVRKCFYELLLALRAPDVFFALGNEGLVVQNLVAKPIRSCIKVPPHSFCAFRSPGERIVR
jgi:hypothetical protein